tara:strand:+ start:51883 stop:53031 length:1149 start_codon:yes stop_codon:yes gene_type:complete
MPETKNALRVLAVEPFYGGSHRVYLDGVVRHSRHDWALLVGSPVHWKWRMRSAPLELSTRLAEHLAKHGHPDVVWCSSMLDLPTFLGFAAQQGLKPCPTVAYFHESQWTYPQHTEARVDFHYGYTNLMTAIAADRCLFNSAFHRDDFLHASEQFTRRMPDAKAIHDFDRLAEKCEVAYPGFEPASSQATSSQPTAVHPASRNKPITVGWVSRWEHDKRPDRFVQVLRSLRELNVPFQLILLGARPREGSADLETIRHEFESAILFDGFAASRAEYTRWLAHMDVVVSTADHEFFGIAICEAIHAGAVAVVPDRLSYRETVGTPTRYQRIDDAAGSICDLSGRDDLSQLKAQGRQHISHLSMTHTVARLDEAIDSIVDHDNGS